MFKPVEAHVHENRDILSGRLWTRLLNGQQVDVVRVSEPDLISGMDLKIKSDDLETAGTSADSIEEGDISAVDDIKDQIQEGRLDSDIVKKLISIFRSFGPEIYMLHEKQSDTGSVENQGLDKRRMGNRVDFDKGPVFVIAAARADEMKGLLENPPADSATAISTTFDIEPWNYLGSEGFIAKYRHPDAKGEQVITQIRFLYAKDSVSESREDQANNTSREIGQGKELETDTVTDFGEYRKQRIAKDSKQDMGTDLGQNDKNQVLAA